MQTIIYILLIIISSGFLGMYPQFLGILFAFLFLYMILRKKFIIPINIEFIMLLVFSISYSIIISNYTNNFHKIVFFLPYCAYYCGYVIAYIRKKNNIEINIILIVFGLFIHAMLNYITNINSISRNTIDIWLGAHYAATLQGTMIVMSMSLLYYIIFYIKNPLKKILCILCVFSAFLYDLVLATRTTIIISILTFFVCYIYDSIIKKKTKKMFKNMLTIAFIIVIFLLLHITNVFNVEKIIQNSSMYSRFLDINTKKSDISRIHTQILAIKQIFKYPLGGFKMDLGGLDYAHNMFLDILNATGFLPFITIIVYYIFNVINMFKILKSNQYKNKFKILLVSIYFSVLLNFMFEPIMEGIPEFFVMFCIINGMVSRLAKDNCKNSLLLEDKYENTLDS